MPKSLSTDERFKRAAITSSLDTDDVEQYGWYFHGQDLTSKLIELVKALLWLAFRAMYICAAPWLLAQVSPTWTIRLCLAVMAVYPFMYGAEKFLHFKGLARREYRPAYGAVMDMLMVLLFLAAYPGSPLNPYFVVPVEPWAALTSWSLLVLDNAMDIVLLGAWSNMDLRLSPIRFVAPWGGLLNLLISFALAAAVFDEARRIFGRVRGAHWFEGDAIALMFECRDRRRLFSGFVSRATRTVAADHRIFDVAALGAEGRKMKPMFNRITSAAKRTGYRPGLPKLGTALLYGRHASRLLGVTDVVLQDIDFGEERRRCLCVYHTKLAPSFDVCGQFRPELNCLEVRIGENVTVRIRGRAKLPLVAAASAPEWLALVQVVDETTLGMRMGSLTVV